MSKLGMIVRADMGGLGNLTKSLWRHLQPDETMVVHLPDPRGKDDANAYPGAYDAPYPVNNAAFRTLCMKIGRGGTLLTVETMYCDDAYRIAAEEGVRTILYAMPELYAGDPADVLLVPTPWELGRMPSGTRVLPMPTDNAPRHRIRTECTTFLHHVAPAMLDRSGTDVFFAAVGLMKENAKFVIHDPGSTRIAGPMVDDRWHDNLWDSYPLEADVMVLPRRYGGLSMPTQEAASTGLPSIMTALPPQTWWGGIHYTPNDSYSRVPMKGGKFDVFNPNPADLAAVMDQYVRGEHDVAALSRSALEWARSISWDVMLEDWEAVCRG